MSISIKSSNKKGNDTGASLLRIGIILSLLSYNYFLNAYLASVNSVANYTLNLLCRGLVLVPKITAESIISNTNLYEHFALPHFLIIYFKYRKKKKQKK